MDRRASFPVRLVLGAALAVVAVLPMPADGASAPVSTAPEVGAPGVLAAEEFLQPGVTYRQYRLEGTRTYVLEIDLASEASLDVAMAKRRFPAFKPTSRMVARSGGIAGVNGDFGLYPGRPGHAFMQNGELKKSTELGPNGKGFAVSDDEHDVYLGGTSLRMEAETPVGTFDVDDWNATVLPDRGQVAAYTPVGGALFPPPSDTCGLQLDPSGPRKVAANGHTMRRTYLVEARRCGFTPMRVDGGLVLATRIHSGQGAMVRAVNPGDEVTVSWSFGWPGALDVIGGSPVVVSDGKNLMKDGCNTPSLCSTHPRTAVGVTDEDRVLLVVMDGRSESSGGATMERLADVMIWLGAERAMNLDGGGSSTMVVRGEVVNKPSDGQERSVSSAIVVLPGAGD